MENEKMSLSFTIRFLTLLEDVENIFQVPF